MSSSFFSRPSVFNSIPLRFIQPAVKSCSLSHSNQGIVELKNESVRRLAFNVVFIQQIRQAAPVCCVCTTHFELLGNSPSTDPGTAALLFLFCVCLRRRWKLWRERSAMANIRRPLKKGQAKFRGNFAHQLDDRNSSSRGTRQLPSTAAICKKTRCK